MRLEEYIMMIYIFTKDQGHIEVKKWYNLIV